jgi:3-oxoacyl-[acyl-carrier-protein] synthase II
LLLLYDAGGYLRRGTFEPVWERTDSPGMVLGSIGAFLVLEERAHAQARGARPVARLLAVLSERSRRPPSSVTEALARMWQQLAALRSTAPVAVISGATGTEPGTREERAWLKSLPSLPVRATGSYIGHGFEPQFAMNIAIAAIMLRHHKLFPPLDSSGVEQPYGGAVDQIAVTSIGHWRGEGMALLDAAS